MTVRRYPTAAELPAVYTLIGGIVPVHGSVYVLCLRGEMSVVCSNIMYVDHTYRYV